VSSQEDSGAGPAVDGRLFTASVSQTFAAGGAAPVPLMIGSNSFEASLMGSLNIKPGMVLARATPAIKAAYATEPTEAAKAEAIFTDAFMGAPARWIAGQSVGGPAWLYRFAYVPAAMRAAVPGAGHDTEIPFVFDSWDHLGDLGKGLKLNDEDRAMTALIHSCWVSFAKTGSPVCAGAPEWPAYARAADTLMNFDTPTTPKSGFNAARYAAQQAAILPTLRLGK
jgi:para-nitrobenzyl esterase